MKFANYTAALVLFLPAISVELLTGDTPLVIFLNPITLIILNLTYGGTLLLIRETVVRWGKGFPSVLVLAGGYGMVNEAIDTKGFFAPHFYAVVGSGLQGFGRYFGINVAWAVNVSIFHAVFSIIVPLIIVSAVFQTPGRWIGSRLYLVLVAGVIACSVFSFKVISLAPDYFRYDEGPDFILLILALMAALLLSFKLPVRFAHPWPLRLNVLTLCLLGSAYTVTFVNFPRLVQTATGSPGVYLAFLLVFYVALPLLLTCKLQEPTARGKVALAAGLLMPMMVSGIYGGAGTRAATGIVLALIVVAFWRNRSQRHLALAFFAVATIAGITGKDTCIHALVHHSLGLTARPSKQRLAARVFWQCCKAGGGAW